MPKYPRVTMRDVDLFEADLDEFLGKATPQQMGAAVTAAARFLEDLCDNLGADANQVNNATSTLCRIYRILAQRVVALEKQLADKPAYVYPDAEKLREWDEYDERPIFESEPECAEGE